MWSITYQSIEVITFTRSRLYDLLAQCRKKNADLGIMGLLLYKSGNFIQTIEGGKDGGAALYDSICNDPRHEDVKTLITEPITSRRFPGWSMAFRDLNAYSVDLPAGFSDLLNEPWTSSIGNHSAAELRAFIEVFMK